MAHELEIVLALDAGRMFSTLPRARKFLFSADLDEGWSRTAAARRPRCWSG